jgi:hypothetical protein
VLFQATGWESHDATCSLYFLLVLLNLSIWNFSVDGHEHLPLSRSLKGGLENMAAAPTANIDLQIVFTALPSVDEVGALSPHTTTPETIEFIEGPSYSLILDFAENRAIAFLHQPAQPADTAFLQCMNLILCLWNLRQGGLAVHGAGIALAGEAVIICGRSGAGKSTLAAALSPPCYVIDEDFCLIIRQNGRFFAGTSPLRRGGDVDPKKNRIVPLKKVYYLAKAHAASVEPVEPGESMRHMARHSYTLPASLQASGAVLDGMVALSRGVGHRRLRHDLTTPAGRYIEMLFGEETV